MKRLLILVLLVLAGHPILAQKDAMVAFWNVENLYDTIDDPAVSDEEFLPSAKKAWTSQRYNTKLTNTAEVILKMNNGVGPDILGMAEVENKAVLIDLTTKTDLKKQKYGIVHYDSPDKRGIDVALIYKTKSFTVLSSASVRVELRNALDSAAPRPTRDILVVRGILNKKDTICILVNHWPSRLGGQEHSDPKRIAAANTLHRIVDSLNLLYPGGEIISVGDYNDEPRDNSLMGLTMPPLDRIYVKGQINGKVFDNLMDSIKQSGDGTHYYKKEKSCLDQILVTPSLREKKSYYVTTACIFKPEWIFAEVYKNDGLSPKRTWAGSRYIGGYSDHLPVYTILKYQK